MRVSWPWRPLAVVVGDFQPKRCPMDRTDSECCGRAPCRRCRHRVKARDQDGQKFCAICGVYLAAQRPLVAHEGLSSSPPLTIPGRLLMSTEDRIPNPNVTDPDVDGDILVDRETGEIVGKLPTLKPGDLTGSGVASGGAPAVDPALAGRVKALETNAESLTARVSILEAMAKEAADEEAKEPETAPSV